MGFWLFLCVVFTIVSKTYCTLNYYLFYVLLPVCNRCFCFFFLSHKCLYSEIFLVDAEIYCCVHGIVTGFSVPFYFSLSSLIFFVVVCQFKTKHSGIIVFMKLQNLVSIHTYRTGLDIINVALTLWCSLDLKMVKVLKRKIE